MSDLSDPTALPDKVREAAIESTLYIIYEREVAETAVDAVTPILAAHFAAELDGLRAQIEEARAHVAKIDIIMYETGSASVGKLEDILAQSPRGTVARIQAGAWAEGYSHCFECPEPGTSLDDNPYTNPFASSGDTTNGDK